MKKKISVLIALLVMAIFYISQSPLYAESTALDGTTATGNDNNIATTFNKISNGDKAGLRFERERIPNAGQKTNDINRFADFMESADFYTGPYEYGVTIIEPLSGQDRCKVYGINNSGQVVGKSYNYSEEQVSDSQAFVWDSTNGYKVLPPLVENAESGVWGINDNGQISGHSYNAEEHKHAVRWDNTGGLVEDITVVDIGTLANTTTGVTGETSTSYGINNLGTVVGYSDIPNDDQSFIAFHAFKYDDATGIQDLGTLTTDTPEYQNGYSNAYSINNNEKGVGLAHNISNSSWEVLPFIHDETSGMQALNIDPAYSGSGFEWHAAVINDLGLIGGRVIAATNQLLPYYWENSSSNPVRITMPTAFPYGEIYGINDSGQMVGMMWDTDQEDAVEHAFIFDIENGVRDLNDLIDPGSQWVLQVALDINNSGQISGTCIYNDEKRGFLLNPINPVGDELAVDFGAVNGLWHYNGADWTQLNAQNSEGMEDWDGGLASDFGSSGLWTYDGSSWNQMTTSNPDGMKAWNDALAVDLGGTGLWSYNGSSWDLLTTNDPQDMESWTNGLAVNLGSTGLWNYDGSTWSLLTTSNSEGMESWANGLAVDFGTFGLWNYNGSTWDLLTTSDTQAMEAWSGGLAVDFDTFGLWNYDGSSWSLLTTSNAEYMAAWASGLAVDFGGTGLWSYDGSSWGLLTTSDAQDMEGWATSLAVDLGASGLWNYDGSAWNLLTTLDSEDMIDVNLY